jgi:uncharacterized RDD family membrane protein YckC
MEQATVSYAGFWKRFVASIIDGIILSIAHFLAFLPLLGLLGLGVGSAMTGDMESLAGMILAFIAGTMLYALAIMILGWLYYALMEISVNQGTLGKMALGIKVTDLNGNRISFGKATGRYFGKILSSMIFMVGYIMAGFTEKKQALHDMMAGCLVVNK